MLTNYAQLVNDGVDILFITLDTLRYDLAVQEFEAGRTPAFARSFPTGWEERHTPASFTYAAHAAFFAGFLPSPTSGPGSRPFALRFAGSTTTTDRTCVLDGASVPEGLALRGYATVCIGGVGFFNKQNPLGTTLPSLFERSHWNPGLGVTAPDSTERQLELAAAELARSDRPTYLFVNISALHQPNCHYLGASQDTVESHAAALRYVDGAWGAFVRTLRRTALLIVCSDHGTAYGEGGYDGHRVGHPVVWTVPYAEALWEVP